MSSLSRQICCWWCNIYLFKKHTMPESCSATKGFALFALYALCAVGLFAIFINKSNEGSLCTNWSHAGTLSYMGVGEITWTMRTYTDIYEQWLQPVTCKNYSLKGLHALCMQGLCNCQGAVTSPEQIALHTLKADKFNLHGDSWHITCGISNMTKKTLN